MIVSTIFKQRRIVLLCVATLALHWLVISWVGARIGVNAGADTDKPGSMAAPVVISAELHLAPSVLSAAPVPSVPAAPARPRHAVARRPPAPQQTASSGSSLISTSTFSPAVVLAGASADAGAAAPEPDPAAPAQTSTDQANTVQASGPESEPAIAAPAPVPSPAPMPTLPRYKVNLPPSAEFVLDVRRVDANGTTWSGVAAMSWSHSAGKYKMSLEAGLNMLITRVNLLVLTSEGEIDDSGIAPVKATEKRRGRSLTATHFERAQGRITFSASEHTYPLLIGTQDKATLPFQLAGIGRADVSQLQGDIDVFVGEEEEANVFRFKLVGEDELDTKLGRLHAWHLSRPPKPGTYSSQLDIWLAPERGWYPVQIRNTESSGAVTTQSVTKITLSDTSGN